MFIGESIGNAISQPLYWRDYFLLSLWGITIIGLIIGLWREGIGGLISMVAALTQFLYLTFEGVKALIFLFILIPSILYIISWYFHKKIAVKV
jgi:hypothetical protein